MWRFCSLHCHERRPLSWYIIVVDIHIVSVVGVRRIHRLLWPTAGPYTSLVLARRPYKARAIYGRASRRPRPIVQVRQAVELANRNYKSIRAFAPGPEFNAHKM